MPNNEQSTRARRLMDEAEAVFTQEGFLHFGTDRLAQRLRCSKRTIYAIAPSHEEFFEAIISRRLERIVARIADLENAPSIEAAMLGFVEASADSLKNVSSLWLRDLMRFPAGALATKQWEETLGNALGRLIERGIREKMFRKVEPWLAAEALLVSVKRMIDPDFLVNLRVNAADAVQQVYEIFWSGLYRRQEKKAQKKSPANR